MCLQLSVFFRNHKEYFVYYVGDCEHERKVFLKYYPRLCNLNLGNLSAWLVGEKIISIDDEEEIRKVHTAEKSSKILATILRHLESGYVSSFYTMLDIMKKYGDVANIEIATEITQALSEKQGTLL